MQAIVTKYLYPDNVRGARIKATCARGSLTISYPHELSGSAVHLYAAQELVQKFAREDLKTCGTPLDANPWLRPRACGELPSGEVAHVFIQAGGQP